MRNLFRVVIGTLVFAMALCAASDAPPVWAYGTPPTPPPPPAQPAKDDGSLKHLSGSTLEFTATQIRNPFGPADWYPGDHPSMPEIVAHGRKPDVRACSLCHYPNGKGRPENAPVAGYPYRLLHQTDAWTLKNGFRKSADTKKGQHQPHDRNSSKSMTDEEIKEAAEYFGSMQWTPWIKVVESKTAPKTRLANGMYLKLEGDEKEPLGQRILETPVNAEATEALRDDRSGFIAYVPVGSLKKGESLVTTGAGKTTQCGACHGADLKGLGPVPGIAGRSPSYLMRLNVRYAARHTERNVDPAHETGGRQVDRRRYAGNCSLYFIAHALVSRRASIQGRWLMHKRVLWFYRWLCSRARRIFPCGGPGDILRGEGVHSGECQGMDAVANAGWPAGSPGYLDQRHQQAIRTAERARSERILHRTGSRGACQKRIPGRA